MEFAASADGDDIVNFDDEENEISASELDALEDEQPEAEGYALNAAEADSKIDEDNFLTSPDDIDELEEDDIDEVNEKRRR